MTLFNEIATNETQKAICFKAAQILPREEYIAFVTAASEHVASGSISKQQFKWALFPSETHLRNKWGHCSRINKNLADFRKADHFHEWHGNPGLNIQERFTM